MNFTYTETAPPDAIKIYVDASLLKKSYCETAFCHTLNGLRVNKKDDSLVIGTAVHQFLAERHGDELAAQGRAMKLYETVRKDKSKFIEITASFPRHLVPPHATIKDKIGKEYYFEIPWLTFVYSGVLYVIVICGTVDHIAFERDILKLFDYKTSKFWERAKVVAAYKNDVQFMFYPWVMWKFGHMFLTHEQANAARDLNMTMQLVTCYAIESKKPEWFVDSPRRFSTQQFEDFEHEVRTELSDKMDRLFADDLRRDGWIRNMCPRCDFNDLCHALPGTEEGIKEAMYHQKTYKPQEHGTPA